MKALFLAILVGFMAATAQADSVMLKLEKNATALVTLGEPERIQLEPLCPPGVTCVTDGTLVTLTYMMPGCLDWLAPVQFRLIPGSTRGRGIPNKIHVSAMAILNAQSAAVRCFAPNYQQAKIALPGVFGPIKVQSLTNAVLAE